jgi:hypothetical protein
MRNRPNTATASLGVTLFQQMRQHIPEGNHRPAPGWCCSQPSVFTFQLFATGLSAPARSIDLVFHSLGDFFTAF